jgi:hypothetical protein
MSLDAGIEPRTGATLALEVRHSNSLARSHPQLAYIYISSTAQLDPIHRSDRSHPRSVDSTFKLTHLSSI